MAVIFLSTTGKEGGKLLLTKTKINIRDEIENNFESVIIMEKALVCLLCVVFREFLY